MRLGTTPRRTRSLCCVNRVVQIYPESGNLGRVLPRFLSEWARTHMQREGVEVHSQSSVERAEYVDGRVRLHLSTGVVRAAWVTHQATPRIVLLHWLMRASPRRSLTQMMSS